jgi:hypothetical protein
VFHPCLRGFFGEVILVAFVFSKQQRVLTAVPLCLLFSARQTAKMTVLIAYFKLSFFVKNHAVNRVSQPFSTLSLKETCKSKLLWLVVCELLQFHLKKRNTSNPTENCQVPCFGGCGL